MVKWLIPFLLFFCLTYVFGGEYSEVVEKDYPLRSLGNLNIVHSKGDVSIHGWAVDKVRVILKKRVIADSSEKAKQLFELLDYRYEGYKDRIEISNQYGKLMNIGDRLQEKNNPKTRSDLVIFAPSKVQLKVWVVDGKVALKFWNERVEVRSRSGSIELENVRGKTVSVACSSCLAVLKQIYADIKVSSKSGRVDLDTVQGSQIFVENESGFIQLFHVEGEQLYISQNGAISGRWLKGNLSFNTQQASVKLKEVSGTVSGATDSGDIHCAMREWKAKDETLLESVQGTISLEMPKYFSANLDLWSLQGGIALRFPFQKIPDPLLVGPEPAGHLVGVVRGGGEVLKVITESGDIHIVPRSDY